MTAGRRPERLAEQIREEVSLIIGGDLEDPRVAGATVTAAKLTPDLRNAKIYVSVLGDDQQIKEAIDALNHASSFIRYQLGAILRIRRVPELRFVFDEAGRSAARIEELLAEEASRLKAAADGDSSGGEPEAETPVKQ